MIFIINKIFERMRIYQTIDHVKEEGVSDSGDTFV